MTPHRFACLTAKVLALLAVPVVIRFILLIGMGVGEKSLPSAMWSFPPPPPLTGTGPFPLMLKFHKVAGSTFVDTMWRNVQCGELRQAWREELCGVYDTHKNLMFVRGGLPFCTRTPTYKIVAVFRRPLDKFVSTLYWYPPQRLRVGAPWNTHIGNWTRQDVRYMLSKLSEDRNPSLQPPLNEYTSVLGSGSAHGGNMYTLGGAKSRRQWDVNDDDHALFAESHSDPTARKRAIARIRSDPDLVLGITERLDESMVLVALSLGWRPDAMLYRSKKTTTNLRPGDARYNVNSGKYHMLAAQVKSYIMYLLRDDERVYHAALAGHEAQTRKHPHFAARVADFKDLLALYRKQQQGAVAVGSSSSMDDCNSKRDVRSY